MRQHRSQELEGMPLRVVFTLVAVFSVQKLITFKYNSQLSFQQIHFFSWDNIKQALYPLIITPNDGQ